MYYLLIDNNDKRYKGDLEKHHAIVKDEILTDLAPTSIDDNVKLIFVLESMMSKNWLFSEGKLNCDHIDGVFLHAGGDDKTLIVLDRYYEGKNNLKALKDKTVLFTVEGSEEFKLPFVSKDSYQPISTDQLKNEWNKLNKLMRGSIDEVVKAMTPSMTMLPALLELQDELSQGYKEKLGGLLDEMKNSLIDLNEKNNELLRKKDVILQFIKTDEDNYKLFRDKEQIEELIKAFNNICDPR